MNEPIKLALTVFARYAILAVCTWLVKHKVMTEDETKTFTDPVVIGSIVVGLGVIAAGMYSRLRSRFVTNAALQLPPSATRADANEVARDASVADVISTNPKTI